jgi:phospholipid transport system substrate-binding protein
LSPRQGKGGIDMKLKLLHRSWLLALVIAAKFAAPVYGASPALEHLSTRIATLQEIMSDPRLAGEQHLAQRRKLERMILEQLFDFHEMSRRALGVYAPRFENRLGEFTPLFIDFLEHAYMGTLEENGDGKIQYTKESVDGDKVQIDTKTRLTDGRELTVSYKLFSGPAGWRAYDVVVEGVGVVDNYRSQFDRVLRKKAFDELLQDLRDNKERF